MTMGFPYFCVDADGAGGVTAAFLGAGVSVNGALPAGYDFVGITVTAPCHWRFGGIGEATPTAVNNDPMLTPNAEPFIVKVPGRPSGTAGAFSTTFAVVCDGTSAGNFNIFGIKEA